MFPMTVTLTVHNAGQLTYLAAMTAPSNDGSEQDATDTQVQAKAEKPKAEKPKAEKPVALSASQQAAVDDTAGLEETNAGKSAPAATAKPTAEVAKADAPAKKVVAYADLQAAVLALHKLDATAAKPIAETMGFPNFKAMPEDKWAEALEKVQAKTEEVKGGV